MSDLLVSMSTATALAGDIITPAKKKARRLINPLCLTVKFRVSTYATRRSVAVGTGRLLSSSTTARAAASLPDLGYDYGELEPAISGEIMKIHHTKHHQVGLSVLHCCICSLACFSVHSR